MQKQALSSSSSTRSPYGYHRGVSSRVDHNFDREIKPFDSKSQTSTRTSKLSSSSEAANNPVAANTTKDIHDVLKKNLCPDEQICSTKTTKISISSTDREEQRDSDNSTSSSCSNKLEHRAGAGVSFSAASSLQGLEFLTPSFLLHDKYIQNLYVKHSKWTHEDSLASGRADLYDTVEEEEQEGVALSSSASATAKAKVDVEGTSSDSDNQNTNDKPKKKKPIKVRIRFNKKPKTKRQFVTRPIRITPKFVFSATTHHQNKGLGEQQQRGSNILSKQDTLREDRGWEFDLGAHIAEIRRLHPKHKIFLVGYLDEEDLQLDPSSKRQQQGQDDTIANSSTIPYFSVHVVPGNLRNPRHIVETSKSPDGSIVEGKMFSILSTNLAWSRVFDQVNMLDQVNNKSTEKHHIASYGKIHFPIDVKLGNVLEKFQHCLEFNDGSQWTLVVGDKMWNDVKNYTEKILSIKHNNAKTWIEFANTSKTDHWVDEVVPIISSRIIEYFDSQLLHHPERLKIFRQRHNLSAIHTKMRECCQKSHASYTLEHGMAKKWWTGDNRLPRLNDTPIHHYKIYPENSTDFFEKAALNRNIQSRWATVTKYFP
jgi:hypothetical protein